MTYVPPNLNQANGDGRMADILQLAAPGDPTLSQLGTPGSSSPAACGPDPFNLDALRLSQDFADDVEVVRALTVIPVRKPFRHEFIRVRPGNEWRLDTAVLKDSPDKETYLVAAGLRSDLAREISPVRLVVAVNRQDDVFLWPLKHGADGRANCWNDSALAASRLAETTWVRVFSDMKAGHYETLTAATSGLEPAWPSVEFKALIELAFRNRLIDTMDHPLLQALRGEA